MIEEDTAQSVEDQAPADAEAQDRAGSDEQERAEVNNRMSRRNAELAAELKQAKQKLGFFEKAEKDRERDEAEKAGDFQKQIELLQRERDEAIAKASGYEQSALETQILDGISEEATANRKLVKGAYLALLEEKGLDRFPTDDVESAIKERSKALRKSFPDLFKEAEPEQPPRGGPPPRQTGTAQHSAEKPNYRGP